jgi:hypothetical protein
MRFHYANGVPTFCMQSVCGLYAKCTVLVRHASRCGVLRVQNGAQRDAKVHGAMEQKLLGSSAWPAVHQRVQQALSIKETQ